MKVAALYDIHGNLPALEAVLAEIELEGGVDQIIGGGDVVWGPQPSECLALLLEVGAAFVSGNCERDVLSPDSDVDRWCHERLGEHERDTIAAWPLVVSDGEVVCVPGIVEDPAVGWERDDDED